MALFTGSAVTREQVREVVLRCRKIASDKKYRAARASSSGVGTMESVGVQTDDLHSLSCSVSCRQLVVLRIAIYRNEMFIVPVFILIAAIFMMYCLS